MTERSAVAWGAQGRDRRPRPRSTARRAAASRPIASRPSTSSSAVMASRASAGGCLQRVDVGQPSLLGAERDILPGLRVELGDLVQRVLQDVQLPSALLPGGRAASPARARIATQRAWAASTRAPGAAPMPRRRRRATAGRGSPAWPGRAGRGSPAAAPSTPRARSTGPCVRRGRCARERRGCGRRPAASRPALRRPPARGLATSASVTSNTALDGGAATTPRARAPRRPEPPDSRPSPVTTIVLPAPVSPVTAVNPGANAQVASAMTPRPRMRSSWITHGLPRCASRSTGRRELGHQPVGERRVAQPREPDRLGVAAHLDPRVVRQGEGPPPVGPEHALLLGRDAVERDHAGRGRDEGPGEQGVRAQRDEAASPRPPARRPGRRRRTSRRWSRSGVATTTPSHSQRDRGRPSISTMRSSIRSSGAFSIETSLSAQVWSTSTSPSKIAGGHRHPLLDDVVAGHDRLDDLVELLALELGEEADVAQVHAQQRDSLPAGALGAPQQRAVTAQDDHQLAASSGGALGHGVDGGDLGHVQDAPIRPRESPTSAPGRAGTGRSAGRPRGPPGAGVLVTSRTVRCSTALHPPAVQCGPSRTARSTAADPAAGHRPAGEESTRRCRSARATGWAPRLPCPSRPRAPAGRRRARPTHAGRDRARRRRPCAASASRPTSN